MNHKTHLQMNYLLAIRRNSAGQVYMLHFSYGDVPSYKLGAYLERAGSPHMRYTPSSGLTFPSRDVYELNEYGKPIRKVCLQCIPASQLCPKQDIGIIQDARLDDNATQACMLLAKASAQLADVDNLVIEYNLVHNLTFTQALNSKAITVRNTVTMDGACEIYAKSAPMLQTMQLQGVCDITLCDAPNLRTILLDMGDIWIPDNDNSNIRTVATPRCSLALKSIHDCAIKVRYLQWFRAFRRSPKEFFDGYTISLRDAQNIKINLEECLARLDLNNCSNVQITCTDIASIKDIELNNCTNVTILCSVPTQSCIVRESTSINLGIECFLLKADASEINYKGNLHKGLLGKHSTITLQEASQVLQDIEVAQGSQVLAPNTVRINQIRYAEQYPKNIPNADVIAISHKDSREGTQILIINRKPLQPNSNNLMRDYPHILYMASTVGCEALDSIFLKRDKCYFDIDFDFEDNPYVHCACAPASQEAVRSRIGAKSVKFLSDSKYTSFKQWLTAENILPQAQLLPLF